MTTAARHDHRHVSADGTAKNTLAGKLTLSHNVSAVLTVICRQWEVTFFRTGLSKRAVKVWGAHETWQRVCIAGMCGSMYQQQLSPCLMT